jgi:hypothetical protein
MARTTTIPAALVNESITCITHYPNDRLTFLVGTGKEVDGKFDFDVPQQFLSFEIKEQNYQDFIADFSVLFTEDNLWTFVDRMRLVNNG